MSSNGDVIYQNGVLLSTIQGLISFDLDKTTTLIYGVKDGDYAFFNCKDTLQSFTVHPGSFLEEIQQYAFYKCH